MSRCRFCVCVIRLASSQEFQRDQFLFRQKEWDVYRTELPVQQGDLTDPAYFDFISFCQYATIASGMRRGRVLFEELNGAEGTKSIVRRDLTLPQTNDALPDAHAARVGERILAFLDDNFPNLAPRVPPAGQAATAASLVAGMQQLDTIFSLNEFMLTSTVAPLADGTGVEWTLVAPANLWGAQVLKLRGDLPNSFEAMAAMAYARRCGVPASISTRFEKGVQVTHALRWPAGFVASS